MAFKIHESGDILNKLSLNRWMIAGATASAFTGPVNAIAGALESTWNEDYTAHQQMAAGTSEMLRAGLIDIPGSMHFGFALHGGAITDKGAWKRFGQNMFGRGKFTEYEAMKVKGAVYGVSPGTENLSLLKANRYRQAGQGNFRVKGSGTVSTSGKSALSMTASEAKAAKGVAGVWRVAEGESMSSGFFARSSKLMSLKGGIASAAAFILAPMAMEATLGLGGRLMDEAHMAYDQSRYHNLDTRSFENRSMQTWEMSKQQQVMSNIMPYEQNMMSLARVYYSR